MLCFKPNNLQFVYLAANAIRTIENTDDFESNIEIETNFNNLVRADDRGQGDHAGKLAPATLDYCNNLPENHRKTAYDA